MKHIIALGLFASLTFNAHAGTAPAKIQNYGGASWSGSCTNLTTGGAQTSQMNFDVSAYPAVKVSINGSSFSLQVGQRANVTLPSKVAIGVLLDLSSDDDFIFHTYNQTASGSQEQQMSFNLLSSSRLEMRQNSWNYSGGATQAGDSYYCKYSR